MKKILIITEANCDDSELMYPYYRIIEAGFEPVIAAFEKKTFACKHYVTMDSDLSVNEVNVDDYSALFLPGGTAPEKLRLNKSVLDIVKKFDEAKKPIGSICHGAQILISAGVTKGRTLTAYPGIADDVKNSGGIYRDEAVVTDKNIVTSRRPQDLPFLMREFIKLCD